MPLRITGPAWTVAEDEAAQSVKLDGCIVTGTAYGDLSSGKVYAQRTLTCSRGEPARSSRRKLLASSLVPARSRCWVRWSAMRARWSSRCFSPDSSPASARCRPLGAISHQAVATGSGAAVANTGLEDIGRASRGSGATSAEHKVADYLIRRAKQYQPVIQLPAGTSLTVLFHEGARLDGRPETNPARRQTVMAKTTRAIDRRAGHTRDRPDPCGPAQPVWRGAARGAILRHVLFTSRHARGPAQAIQVMVGHQDLITAQHYMHLSPTATEGGHSAP